VGRQSPEVEVVMIKSQSLAVQEKKELPGKEEKTVTARYFVSQYRYL